MFFISISLIGGEVRLYDNEETALKDSIRLNEADLGRPSFELHKVERFKKAGIYMGKLRREFGTNKFFWGE